MSARRRWQRVATRRGSREVHQKIIGTRSSGTAAAHGVQTSAVNREDSVSDIAAFAQSQKDCFGYVPGWPMRRKRIKACPSCGRPALLADRRADKAGDDAVDLNIIGHEPTAARRVRKVNSAFRNGICGASRTRPFSRIRRGIDDVCAAMILL